MARVLLAAWLVLAIACSSGAGSGAGDPDAGGADAGPRGLDAGAVADPYAPFFEADRVLEVDIELARADWDRLRFEGRSPVDLFSGCVDRAYTYTWVSARVTVDGETLEDVGVRKKGYLGSLSTVRPSLKLDFAQLVPEQRLRGIKRMTLNNDRQDPSHTHQCSSYGLFRAAGVPAPRCSLARVRVNGEELGIYSHVESIKKPFLEEHFSDPSGNLYEGQGADFRPGYVDRLELKTNERSGDRSDAEALTTALTSPAAELEEALAPLLDLDAFETFWAMEVLTSHWDGYSGDLNNYYVYSQPDAGFSFIPWGTDGAFSDHAFLPASAPTSVYAVGELSRRLYDHAPTRERYRARLGELLDMLWDEASLLDEVDRVAMLAGSDADAAALDAQRAFIRDQRQRLAAELEGPAPAWALARRSLSGCRDAATALSAHFTTRWGSLDAPVAGVGDSLELSVDGSVQSFATVLSAAGVDPEAEPPQPVIRVIGAFGDGRWLVAQVRLGPVPVTPGEIPLHGMETVGYVVEGGAGQSPRVLGLFGDGSLVLDQGGTTAGAAVSGRFEGRWVPLPGLFQ